MARGEPPEPRSDLPAPYRSPWRWLAEALEAVLAAVALKLRELWRRNRQGSLPLPGFWPRSLAALFWPLLLGLALLPLALLLTLALPTARPPGADQPGSGASAGVSAASGPLPATTATSAPSRDRSPWPPQARQQAAEGMPAAPQRSAPTAAAAGRSEPPASVPRALDQKDEPAVDQAAAAEPPPAALQLDPLLALLSDPQERDLLQAAQPDPATALLRLRLSERAASLSDRSLLERAGRWQQRALEAGYERLELLDADGSLRARQALVGSGMILLAPSSSQP